MTARSLRSTRGQGRRGFARLHYCSAASTGNAGWPVSTGVLRAEYRLAGEYPSTEYWLAGE